MTNTFRPMTVRAGSCRSPAAAFDLVHWSKAWRCQCRPIAGKRGSHRYCAAPWTG